MDFSCVTLWILVCIVLWDRKSQTRPRFNVSLRQQENYMEIKFTWEISSEEVLTVVSQTELRFAYPYKKEVYFKFLSLMSHVYSVLFCSSFLSPFACLSFLVSFLGCHSHLFYFSLIGLLVFKPCVPICSLSGIVCVSVVVSCFLLYFCWFYY